MQAGESGGVNSATLLLCQGEKPVLSGGRVVLLPRMWSQRPNLPGQRRLQSGQHRLQILFYANSAALPVLHHRRHGRDPLPRSFAPEVQPVLPPKRSQADSVLHPIIVRLLVDEMRLSSGERSRDLKKL